MPIDNCELKPLYVLWHVPFKLLLPCLTSHNTNIWSKVNMNRTILLITAANSGQLNDSQKFQYSVFIPLVVSNAA